MHAVCVCVWHALFVCVCARVSVILFLCHAVCVRVCMCVFLCVVCVSVCARTRFTLIPSSSRPHALAPTPSLMHVSIYHPCDGTHTVCVRACVCVCACACPIARFVLCVSVFCILFSPSRPHSLAPTCAPTHSLMPSCITLMPSAP